MSFTRPRLTKRDRLSTVDPTSQDAGPRHLARKRRTDPTSPTGAAVRNYTEAVGTEQRDIQVNSILAQSQEDEANAAYLRYASSQALLSGDVSAIADILKGASGAVSSFSLSFSGGGSGAAQDWVVASHCGIGG
jgi:hypothetical protein